jgi:hypothetical protein
MGTKVGLWIDHRKAIIVAVTDKGEEARLIISKAEKQLSAVLGIPLLRGAMKPCRCPRTIAARKRLQDISTFIMMR